MKLDHFDRFDHVCQKLLSGGNQPILRFLFHVLISQDLVCLVATREYRGWFGQFILQFPKYRKIDHKGR